MKKHYLNVSEVADLLAFSERHVRLLIVEGKIPAIRIGHSYRVDVAELEAYLEAARVREFTFPLEL